MGTPPSLRRSNRLSPLLPTEMRAGCPRSSATATSTEASFSLDYPEPGPEPHLIF